MGYIIGLQNSMYSLVRNGLNVCDGGIGPAWHRGVRTSCGSFGDGTYQNTAGKLNFSPSSSNASNGAAVVSELALLLTAGRMSTANQNAIENAYANSFSNGGAELALQVALVLMISSPEFHATNIIQPNHAEPRAPSPVPEQNETVPYKAVVHVNLFVSFSMPQLPPRSIPYVVTLLSLLFFSMSHFALPARVVYRVGWIV